ncbi:MAG: SGNH/GDSL hydrolase family protein, partial [Rhizorhabdus sp.]
MVLSRSAGVGKGWPVAAGRIAGVVTPAPSFTAQPSVSPSSGTAGTTTFTATPGTVSNGSVTARSWKLNGNEISTALTALANAGGTLTYQETATGAGGTMQSAVQQVAVAAASTGSTGTVPDGTQAKIIGVGDSIMRGLSGGGHVALSQLGYPSSVTIENRGQDNRTLWEAAYDAQANSGWGSITGSLDSTKNNVVVLQRITNDLGKNSGIKADVAYGDMAMLVRFYQNQGTYVAVVTCLPRFAEWDSTKEAERIKYNNLVRANGMGADLIIDAAADSIIGDSGDLASKSFQTSYPGAATTYYADGVHLTAAGQDRMGVIYQYALPALLTLSPRAKNLYPGGSAANFSVQPVISPSSGGVGTTYTATPGTITNGRLYSRSWKLAGSEISTGLTATPNATGTLTYQEIAYGTAGGGNAQSSVITTTVGASTPAAAFTAQPTVSPSSGTASSTT